MKLHGHSISLTTLQVMALLASKNFQARFVPVDVLTGRQKQPAHRELHPFGHIPVLEDNGFRLIETHAILRYLDSRLPGRSYVPTDLTERARMDQWLCIEQNYLLPASKKVMADLCWWADLHKLAAMPLASSPIEDHRIRPWWSRVSEREDWQGAIAQLAAYGAAKA